MGGVGGWGHSKLTGSVSKVEDPFHDFRPVRYMGRASIVYKPIGTRWVKWSVLLRTTSLSEDVFLVPILARTLFSPQFRHTIQ